MSENAAKKTFTPVPVFFDQNANFSTTPSVNHLQFAKKGRGTTSAPRSPQWESLINACLQMQVGVNLNVPIPPNYSVTDTVETIRKVISPDSRIKACKEHGSSFSIRTAVDKNTNQNYCVISRIPYDPATAVKRPRKPKATPTATVSAGAGLNVPPPPPPMFNA